MPLKERAWYPWLSVVGWMLVTFMLVLVNSGGSVVLAAALALVVAAITWRIETARRKGRAPSGD